WTLMGDRLSGARVVFADQVMSGNKFLDTAIRSPPDRRSFVTTTTLPLGGRRLADYRVYVIGRDGHIVDAIVVSCADDQAAVRAAEGLLRKDTLELWLNQAQVDG